MDHLPRPFQQEHFIPTYFRHYADKREVPQICNLGLNK